MASAFLVQENPPSHSLLVDTPASSSPFPSPSSTFTPPPMLSSHEFALRSSTQRSSRKLSLFPDDQSDSTGSIGLSAPSEAGPDGGAVTPTATTPSSSFTSPLPPQVSPSAAPSQPQSQVESPAQTASSRPSSQGPTTQGPPTSTRPAPPSPSVSRRESTRSRTSLPRSRPPSDAGSILPPLLSRSNSTLSSRKLQLLPTAATGGGGTGDEPGGVEMTTPTQLEMSTTPTSALGQPPPPPTSKPPFRPESADDRSSRTEIRPPKAPPITIRDFAFSAQDARYGGLGTDVPKPNRFRRLVRRLRPSSIASSDVSSASSGCANDEDDEDGERQFEGEDEQEAFRRSVDRFSRGFWNLGFGSGPSGPSSGEIPGEYGFEGADEEEEEEEEEGEYHSAEDHFATEEDELEPGIYRALYAFEPEGTAEMALADDQLVKVVGRGGGVGWAVVVRGWDSAGANGSDEGEHALVPESYLEWVREAEA